MTIPVPDALLADLTLIGRLVVAVAFAVLIGWDREVNHRSAGLRTHLLVSLGSCAFTVAGITLGGMNDQARVAAQIVTGIGFLGAGVIWKSPSERAVHGLTTAASLWIVASIGMLVGCGAYLLGVTTTLLGFAILRIRPRLGSQVDRVEYRDTRTVEEPNRLT